MRKAIYKPDGKHRIWGMKLQLKVIDDENESLDEYLEDGWKENPKECKPVNPFLDAGGDNQNNPDTPAPAPAPEPDAPTNEDIDTDGDGKVENNEIREAAKEAGISEWKTARIKTLKKKLNYSG
jgi:hypothetical protein